MPDAEVAAPPPKEHWATKAKRERDALAAASSAPTDPPVTETLGAYQGAEIVAVEPRYMDPADFYGPVLAALLASGRSEAHHLIAFGKQAWCDYKALVDWARTDGR